MYLWIRKRFKQSFTLHPNLEVENKHEGFVGYIVFNADPDLNIIVFNYGSGSYLY
jgi:hypothetical protein